MSYVVSRVSVQGLLGFLNFRLKSVAHIYLEKNLSTSAKRSRIPFGISSVVNPVNAVSKNHFRGP